jgi:hypothetical protein
MSNVDITIGYFHFKAFIRSQQNVVCDVDWDGPFDEAIPAEEVRKILEDLGKWEALTKAVGDLSLANVANSGTENFGRNRYGIEVQVEKKGTGPSRRAYVTFSLAKNEALRRTGGMHSAAPLDVTEITNQIQSLPKWRNFTTAVNYVKEIQPSESESSTEA